MSTTDDRIVKLQFDNSGFEAGATKAISILEKLERALKFDSATAGLDAVKKSVDGFKMDGVSESVEQCSSKFSAFEAFVTGIFLNLGSKVANFGLDLAKKVTLQPLMDGFSEYELQMKSVQTILSNAGDKLAEQGYTTQEEKIAVINDRLDELNKYADKTIYNFSEMTRNIGTFTAAGVDLDTATKSIQGIANLAAASGSSSQQASTAMYQLSQAIAAGSVKLQDWNSVVNAGMGGELFQNALKRTARAHGVAVDEMIAKNGSFRESLQEGWITSDILTETLEQLTMTYGEVGDEAYNANMEILKNQGYSEEDAKAILELAKNAEEAATKVRTWSQLWETVGEALGSGWATTWRLIVGDFLEATDLFTFLSDRISGVINASANARNAVLSDWAGGGGRTALVDGIKYLVDAIISPIEAIGTAFSDVFGITGEQLYNITVAFATFAEKLVPSQAAIDFLYQAFYNVFTVIHSVIGVVANVARAFFDIAGVVWKVISPLVKFGLVIGGGILKAIAWLSAQIHLLTDYFEGFVSFITDKLGLAIDVIYDFFGGIFSYAGKALSKLGGAGKIIRDVAIAIGQLIIESAPVQFVIDVFKAFYDIIADKVVTAMEKLKSIFFPDEVKAFATSFENLTPFQKFEYKIEEIAHGIETFFKGLYEAKDKIGYLKEHISSAFDAIKTKIEDFFSMFSSPKSLYDFFEIIDSKIVDGIFAIFGNNEIGEMVHGWYDSIATPLFDFFHNTIAEADSWGDIFGPLLDGAVDVLGDFERSLWDLPGPIGQAIEAFSHFGGSIKNFVSKTAFPKVKEAIESIKTYFASFKGLSVKDSVVKFFNDIKTKLQEIIPKIPGILSDFKNELLDALPRIQASIKDFFTNMFSNMPSPEEILGGISAFFSNIKDSIGGFASGLGSTEGFGSILSGIFDFSNFKINIPNISNLAGMIGGFIEPLLGFVGQIKDVAGGALRGIFDFLWDLISSIPVDETETTFKRISKIFKQAIKAGFIFQAFRLLGSIVSLNKGIGKFGKNFRKGLEGLGDGLKNFGSGFTEFKKQTKAQAFMRIAEGILILAGALFVIAMIPADRLKTAASTLLYLGIASAGLILLSAAVSKLADLDLEAVGKAIGGFGIGLLALAAATWIFSKIPSENFAKAIGGLVTSLVFLAAGIALIAKAGGDVEGVASAALGMAGAITLLLIPITILGLMPMGILAKGMIATGIMLLVLGASIALIEIANKHKGSIASASLAALGLAAAITLMVIPITILGTMKQNVLKQGGVAVGQIAIVLALAVGVIGFIGKYAGGILASIPAMGAFIISIIVMKSIIESLGNMADPSVFENGRNALIQISVILGVALGVMAICGTLGTGIAKATVALIAFGATITILLFAMGEMAKLAATHPEGMTLALEAVATIVLGIAALALVGSFAGGGLLGLALGLAAVGASFLVLAGGIYALTKIDWGSIVSGIQSVWAEFTQTHAGQVMMGFVEMLLGACDVLGSIAQKIYDSFVKPFLALFGIASPSKVMQDAGEDTMQGFFNGILQSLGLMDESGNMSGQNFLDAFQNMDIPGKLGETAAQAFDSFMSKLDVEALKQQGIDMVTGLLEGIGADLVGKMQAKASEVFHSFVDPIAQFFGIASPSTYMRDTIGTNIIQGLIDGITNFLGPLGTAAGNIATVVKDGAGGLISAGVERAKDFGGGLLRTLSGFVGGARNTTQSVSDSASSGLNGLKGNMSTKAREATTAFITSISSRTGNAKAAAMTLVNAIKSSLSSMPSMMRSAGHSGASGFVSGVGSAAGSAYSAGSNLSSSAVRGASGGYGSMYSIGQNLSVGLANGINSAAWMAESAASRLEAAAERAVKAKAKVKSPSRVFRAIGGYIGEGFVLGMLDKVRNAYDAGTELAGAVPSAFADAISDISIDDFIETDLSPVITPVINPAEFDSSMSRLSTSMGTLSALSVGNLNYTQEMSAKFTDYMDANEAAIEAMARNAIDYDRLGVSVASALINAGFHVEMDGGELMGYLAGQISDTRRMYATR